MVQEQRTEVLVVGAGPVGMLTALLLSEAGVQVRIIDRESRTTSRTYACALHSRTLGLLDKLGIARDVMAAGRVVDRVAFYEGASRRAEVNLAELPADFPFVVVVPQSVFEHLLEERLRKDGTVRVSWNHQLTGLNMQGSSAVAVIDELGVSAKGYIIPEMEWSVKRTEQTEASFVVGADGPNSFLAQTLGAQWETVGESEFYAVYEIETDWECENELRVVLDKDTTSVLWPLAGNKYRWGFQLRQEHLEEFPSKDRSPILLGGPTAEKASRAFLQKLIQQRAPWFDGTIDEVGWSTDVEFAHRVASSFGRQRCWLVGDAAHQTAPAAMQSMNLGLLEAERLANTLIKILRQDGSHELLSEYDQSCRAQWRQLLGLSGSVRAKRKGNPWIAERSSRILSCLPGSGADLGLLLAQLQFELV